MIGNNIVNSRSPIAIHKTNAYPDVLNKFVCLSVHWDVPSGPNGSSVYCNGNFLTKFETRTSPGSSKMTFGNLNPQGVAGSGFNGDIALFYYIVIVWMKEV